MNFSLGHTMQTFTGKMKRAFLPFAASFGTAWLQGLFTGNFSSSRQKDQPQFWKKNPLGVLQQLFHPDLFIFSIVFTFNSFKLFCCSILIKSGCNLQYCHTF